MVQVLLGVDIGGTNIKVGVVTEEGKLLKRCIGPLDPNDRSPNAVVELIGRLSEDVLRESKILKEEVLSIGIATPGVLVGDGVIHAAANFPTWVDVPLKALVEERLAVHVKMCNDADAAILAEHWVGSAKENVQNFVMLTLGTGVGCGIVADGKLVNGGSGMIEGGHMIVEKNGRLCGCTQRGCLEAYCSASALADQARKRLDEGAKSAISSHRRNEIDAKLVFEFATKGDELCQELVDESADYLGFACVSICRILDPEMIVLAGGMAEAGSYFNEKVRSAYNKYTWTKLPNPVKIEKASAGYDAGIIGAAAVGKKA